MRCKLWMTALLVLTLVGCQKRYSAEQIAKSAPKVTLIGLPAETLIRTKYDQLKIVCTLNVNPRDGTAAIALAGTEWDLFREFGDNKVLEFSSALGIGSKFKIEVKLDRLTTVPTLVTRDESGAEFMVKNTPVFQARVHWHHQMGSLSQKGSTPRIPLIEGIPTTLLAIETSTIDFELQEFTKRLRVTCETQAVVKEPYKDEFIKKSRTD